ncbi:UNVERIFIED_CONTAM: hypothetical protein FKN15_054661 [Acipenser sinensis]
MLHQQQEYLDVSGRIKIGAWIQDRIRLVQPAPDYRSFQCILLCRPLCSQPRATASEDNAALSSLQASPQAPGQSTGVAGAQPTMQPTQSYSVRGQRSSGQLTGKPAGARPVYRGRWCAVSRGHPGQPKPSPHRVVLGQLCAAPWEPVHGWQWNSLDLNR